MAENDKTLIATEPEETALVPFDDNPHDFKAALARRGDNRQALMQWIRQSLVQDVDFGRIQTKRGLSKPSLWKPGAEKICGMMGLRATFPTLSDYEQAVIQGVPLNHIILRCHLVDQSGRVVSDGVGSRSIDAEGGDVNKALKMAAKSAMIDATLRCAGLSEVFTQDTDAEPDERQPAPEQHTAPAAPGERKITDGQVRLLRAKLRDTTLTEDLFKEYFIIEHMADLPFAKMNVALEHIAKYGKQVPGG